jgi:hypothetical protein
MGLAAEALPTLKEHLQQIESIASNGGVGASQERQPRSPRLREALPGWS